jgi:hypothetical protein
MHDGRRLKILDRAGNGARVNDVCLQKTVVIASGQIGQGIQIARIGQLVQIQDFMALMNHPADEIGTDKSGTSCDDDTRHENALLRIT